MSVHDFYTIVQKKGSIITFLEAVDLDEFEDSMEGTVRIYEKHTDMSHEEFKNVPDDATGLWFVAQIKEDDRHHGYEFQTAGELRKALSSLLKDARVDDTNNPNEFVVIYPPNAKLVEEEKWIYLLDRKNNVLHLNPFI